MLEFENELKDLGYNLIAGMDSRKKVQVKFDENVNINLKYLPFKLGIMNVDRILDLGWYPQVGVEDTFRFTLESFLQRKS